MDAENPLVLLLSGLQDPGNAGTILRVGESFHASGCITLKGTVSLFNSKVVRASAGSLFRFPWVGGAGCEESITLLRSRRISVVGTDPAAGLMVEKWNWREPTALLLGNEGRGLPPRDLELCDTVVRIPQNPSVDSLNTAMAAAVILYEASRQRRNEGAKQI